MADGLDEERKPGGSRGSQVVGPRPDHQAIGEHRGQQGKEDHAQASIAIDKQGARKKGPAGGPEENRETMFAFTLKNGFEGGPGTVVIADFEFVVESVELGIVVVPWRERLLPKKRGSALK